MLYDTIIIGAGPAGLTASIYASRYMMNHVVIGKIFGGTITLAHRVENFPGFVSISGPELAGKMGEQAKALGAQILADTVGRIEVAESENGKLFRLFTESGKRFEAKSLIVTTGTERRKLNVPGEKEYLGRGVSYCTYCDAPFFKGKTVVLVGGSNAACSGAIHLAEFAAKEYLVYRKDELRGEAIWVEEIKKNPKIEIVYNTNVIKILGTKDGSEKVVGVELDNPYKGEKELKADGVFVEIGGVPLSSLLIPIGVKLDENNYVIVSERMETNIEGIFAAGDFTTQSLILSQTITACADGAIATASAYKYVKGQKPPKIMGS